MVRVTQLADDGTEMAAVEVDDFTIEVIYSGLADMLREPRRPARRRRRRPATCRARRAERRQRVLSRIRD